ncbi:MAG TPA: O-antigen ligase family protein [Chromatiaceae bacterium]|nr:O-antigen ligase family protein [Chromatiaceae bacterium]
MKKITSVSEVSRAQTNNRFTTITAGLVVCACAMLPFSRSVEIPMALLTFIGLYFGVTEPALRANHAIRQFSVIFLLFFVPMLLALPDAVNLEISAAKTLVAIRYYLAGITIIFFLRSDVKRVFPWISAILIIWSVDAFIQVYTGTDVFGYHYSGGRINGMFGGLKDGLKLGWGIVIFFPVCLVWFIDRFSWPVTLFLGGIIFYALVLSGTRSAWVVGILEIILLSVYLLYTKKIRWVSMVLVSVMIVGVAVAGVQSSSGLMARVDRVTAVVGNPDYQTVDHALSRRLPIWETAIRMIEDNWLNGVGVRGFRYAYTAYAEEGNHFVAHLPAGQDVSLATHAHQLILEVMAETGVIGLIGLVGIFVQVVRIWLASSSYGRWWSLPFAVALVSLLFPFNSLLAFYSSWFAQQFWLLMALFIAVSISNRDPIV